MLLEREPELEQLAYALGDVATSGGRVVLIRGEGGTGKTALVEGFLAIHRDETHVLVGSCDDLSTPQPLGPFWDIARRGENSVLRPLRSGDMPGVLMAMYDLLTRSLRPTILVVEDTQWADEATLDAIQYLGRRVGKTHGLLILTYRDSEVDLEHPLRAVIGAFEPRRVIRIRLAGLSAGAVAHLAEGSGEEVGDIMALTNGNPLFVRELLAFGASGVPLSVQDLVLARLAKLSSRAREVVELVSVIPGEAEKALVFDLLGESAESLVESERQGLLQVGEATVWFRHELIRRAVESSLASERKTFQNGRVLEWLSATASADPSRLAHHAREADDSEALVAYAPAAARQARGVAAHREAVAHYRALEQHLDLVAGHRRALLLEEWADSERYTDNYPAALTIIRRAIDLYRSAGDRRALVRSLLEAVEIAQPVAPGEPDRLLEEALAILEHDPASPELALAVNLRAWLAMMSGNGREASVLANRAIELSRQTGAAATLIHAMSIKGLSLYRMGDERGKELLEEARIRASADGLLFQEARATYNLAGAAVRQGELRLAETCYRRLAEIAEQSKLPIFEIPLHALHAEMLVASGEWDLAENEVTEALTSTPYTSSIWAPEVDFLLGTLQTRFGRPQSHDALERAWASAAEGEDLHAKSTYAAALAENMWVTGATDVARLRLFREILEESVRLDHLWNAGRLALWLWKLDEVFDAPEGIAEPYRLIIAGEALKAAQVWEELGYPYEMAIALAHGDTQSRLQALEILETLGAAAVAARLRRELREGGLFIPRGRALETRRHPIGLTARQNEVLLLLADGLTNAEIADRLFLSTRTVEHHVAAVMGKLDASTREEAVALAADRGVLPQKSPIR